MTAESTPLTPMGTQSWETMDMERAATAAKARHDAEDLVAGSVLDRLTRSANDLMAKARAGLQDASDQLREQAVTASDRAAGYAREEPVKALLVAGAVGALLMAMVVRMARPRD